jgi:hypothetical protein
MACQGTEASLSISPPPRLLQPKYTYASVAIDLLPLEGERALYLSLRTFETLSIFIKVWSLTIQIIVFLFQRFKNPVFKQCPHPFSASFYCHLEINKVEKKNGHDSNLNNVFLGDSTHQESS